MKLLLQKNLRTPADHVEDIQQLLVTDDDGDLLAIMWHLDDGSIALSRKGEKDFERLCKQLGVKLRSTAQCVTL